MKVVVGQNAYKKNGEQSTVEVKILIDGDGDRVECASDNVRSRIGSVEENDIELGLSVLLLVLVDMDAA